MDGWPEPNPGESIGDYRSRLSPDLLEEVYSTMQDVTKTIDAVRHPLKWCRNGPGEYRSITVSRWSISKRPDGWYLVDSYRRFGGEPYPTLKEAKAAAADLEWTDERRKT